MLVDHFPLFGLRLTTPRLELRLPAGEELAALADVAAGGVHDPDVMPFQSPWTANPPAQVARSVVQYHWRQLGAWSPEKWSLDLAAFHQGAPIGIQSIGATDFAVTREVSTGSWLGRRYHGQGFGTEMRAAVLALAFAGLDAEAATSSAFAHNAASLGVSRKLGYQPDGVVRRAIQGTLTVDHRLRLTRAGWQEHRAVGVVIDGLAACLPLLGLDTVTHAAGDRGGASPLGQGARLTGAGQPRGDDRRR
jgi:RimJ/RimL family protein N-acetyltransferase